MKPEKVSPPALDKEASPLDKPDQEEGQQSSKQAPGKPIRLTFKGRTLGIIGNSKKPPAKMHRHSKDEDDETMTNKRMRNQELQAPEEPPMENNVPSGSKAHPQNNDAVMVIERELDRTDVNPTTLLESQESPSCFIEPKQTELPSSSKEAPNRKGTHGGSTVFPVESSEKPLPKKQELPIPEELSIPEEPLVENDPATLKARMENNNAVLVIRKKLTKTDVNPIQSRLSIPQNQMINHNFLTDEELQQLIRNEHVDARLIEPSGAECDIKLKMWKMTSSMTYNLTSSWNQVVQTNNLKKHTPIELYSFREGQQLYFALIKLQP